VRFNQSRAGDLYDIQQATYEYKNCIMSHEACNYNGLGLGGRTEGQRYYGARGTEDRPHRIAFYGAEASLFVDRIGMELYSEGGGGMMARGGARRGSDAAAPPAPPAKPSTWPERMHMNEDEPTPLHTEYFVDFVRARKEVQLTLLAVSLHRHDVAHGLNPRQVRQFPDGDAAHNLEIATGGLHHLESEIL